MDERIVPFEGSEDDRSKEIRDFAFKALMAEADLLRKEALSCIENVRRLALSATYIAGGALPIIAGLLAAKEAVTGITGDHFIQAVQRNALMIQLVCSATSLACLSILFIYVGNFLQIFTFAKYFRVHLIPEINVIIPNSPVKLLHWENCLQQHRKKKSSFIGDVDLTAEPVLISLYVLAYGCADVLVGFLAGSYPLIAILFLTGLITGVGLEVQKLLDVLRSAAAESEN